MKKLVIFLFIFVAGHYPAQVIISEVMSDNDHVLEDFEGDSPDWLEISNLGEHPVDISGWFISDDEDEMQKWVFPNSMLNAGQQLLIFASGKDLVEQWHTNFKIGSEGEALFLSNNQGTLIHVFPAVCIPEDESAIAHPEDGRFYFSEYPTPNEPNPIGFDFPCKTTLSVSRPAGFYPSSIEVEILENGPYSVFYSTNGSELDPTSGLYTDPITLNKRTLNENDLSFIPTAEDWSEPKLPLPKATVLRARAFYNGCPVSETLSESYFIGQELAFPKNALVFSMSTDVDGFFSDEVGIYVPGLQGGNYLHPGENWERDCHLEVFTDQGEKVIGQDCQVKNRGKSSRFKPQKSLRFTAKDKYGSGSFNYPFFERRDLDSFKSVNLRTGQAGFTQSMFADVLSASLLDGMHVDFQESKLTLLYLNGEYWGIHDARENLDEHYLEQYYGLDEDSVIILKNNAEVLEGNNIDYLHLVEYIENNDLSEAEHYDHVLKEMDIASFIDFNIMHMYAANWDWPHNNVEYWKSLDADGKFRWFFFDCDACFYKDGFNSMDFFEDPTTTDWDKVLLSNLFTNDKFRSQFTIRLYQLLSSNFNPSIVLSKIDSLEQLYAPFMFQHIQRWNQPTNYSTWQNHLEEMKIFALTRPQKLVNFIQENFGSPLTFFPNPAADVLYTDLPGEIEGVEITVFDGQGKLVMRDWYGMQGVDISNLKPGIYLVRVTVGEVSFTDRIIKI